MRSERKRRGRKINILQKNIESTIQRQIQSVVDLASFLRPQNQRLRGATSTWRCVNVALRHPVWASEDEWRFRRQRHHSPKPLSLSRGSIVWLRTAVAWLSWKSVRNSVDFSFRSFLNPSLFFYFRPWIINNSPSCLSRKAVTCSYFSVLCHLLWFSNNYTYLKLMFAQILFSSVCIV